jgi:hypothetical protein
MKQAWDKGLQQWAIKIMKKEMNQTSEINRLKNMKRYLLIFLILLGGGSLIAQTVSSLSATGTAIKWYSASSGGILYTGTEPLVNGTTYYASQTVNGQESSTRFAVIATVTATPAAPTASAHVAAQVQIVWNWSSVSGATGYRWNTTNVYGSATDMGTLLTSTESGLTCNTAYTRYVWAYNASGCVSGGTTLTQTTSSCISAPTLVTSAVSNIGSTSATLNGNITAINGANVTTRGFKYSTTSGFNPATSGTNITESGTFGAGAFSLSPSGLLTITTYYVVAYATNSAGTSYGTEVSFISLIQTDFGYTGGQQTFVVPAGVTSVTIEAWGAQGGDGTGGLGGYSTGTLSVSPGQTLFIYVGGQGATNQSGGFNGGGTGGVDTNPSGTNGSGGGGASDVRAGGNGLGNRVIIAGGGGGRAPTGAGANGGGASGLDAVDYITGFGGHGGTQSAGGGVHTDRNATSGGYGYGGNGSTNYNAWGGGGGGGGFYGGGGGTSTVDHGSGYSGGGGGGSSYTGGVTSGSTTSGSRSGNGQIKITY